MTDENNYGAGQIRILKFPEAIRKRPGMYLGSTEPRGINILVYELVANSVDQFLAGSASTIKVRTNSQLIVVEDDGPGMPFGKTDQNGQPLVERYLTTNHNKPTADDHIPHIHILLGGMGLVVANALSSRLLIESSDGKNLWRQTFGKGRIASEATCEPSHRPQGTRIEMTLDTDIFGDRFLDRSEFRKTMFELVHFFPGLTIELDEERFHSKRGLLDLANLFYKGKCHLCLDQFRTFHFHGKQDDVQLQIAAIGESVKETEYFSWVNGGETVEGGTHVNGLKRVFRRVKWRPGVALIHVIMHDPRYAGPVKSALSNRDIANKIEAMLEEPMKTWLGKDLKARGQKWRNLWLHSVSQYACTGFYYNIWLSKQDYIPDFEQYLKENGLEDGYDGFLEIGYMSEQEVEAAKPFHDLLKFYLASCQEQKFVLKKSDWRYLVKSATALWNCVKDTTQSSRDIERIRELEDAFGPVGWREADQE